MIPEPEPWGLANFKSSPMKFPQQALGRTQPGPGLLDPLLQGNDQGAQRGGVLDDRGERSLLQVLQLELRRAIDLKLDVQEAVKALMDFVLEVKLGAELT